MKEKKVLVTNRNLGVYIETVVHFNYNFRGRAYTDEIYVIYSNLSRVTVEINQTLNAGTVIGYGGGAGTNIYNNSDVYLYIYTKRISPYLGGRTNNSFLEEYGVFWWDALKLFNN